MKTRRSDPRILRRCLHFIRDRKAATAIEYGLIVSLIVIAMIGAFVEVANVTTGLWSNISTKVAKTN